MSDPCGNLTSTVATTVAAAVEKKIDVSKDDEDQVVTPWTVTSKNGINYMKLVDSFGSTPIDGALIRRFEEVTKCRAHRFLRRGLFFSHRDLEMCLDAFERGEEVYLYTGRGPTSEAMHLGHMVPFEFTKYLQDAFQAILVVQLSDDEKFYFKDEGMPLEHYCRLSRENARDIIARGFNLSKTYIFSNTDEVGGELQRNVVRMMKATRGSTIRGIFGLTSENSNIGQLAWPIYQSVPAYSTSFPFLFGSRNVPCLVPMAIDQDPYFRLARDFVQTGPGRGLLKPPVIHSEFLVGLGGINDKMSSSTGAPSLFLTDSAETIREKITKFAFSGGGASLKLHREHGATLEVDVPYQYLLYFLEDDEELARVAKAYSTGVMKTSEIKELMIKVVTDFVLEHQKRRTAVTDEVLQDYFSREREFDHSREARDTIELLDDAQYASMGINFDRYFGCAKQ